MIDTHGNVRLGKPRRGHEMVEYAKLKAQVLEMLDLEVPDQEIAARIGVTPNGFYKLKKRILKEAVPSDIAANVAARLMMRDERQLRHLIAYMDRCYAADIAPDAAYITAYTNLSRRIADLVGANAAIAFTIDHGDDDEGAREQRSHNLAMAQELNRFYELQDRLRGPAGIGSGLTKDERDRELANMEAALALEPGDLAGLPGGDDDDTDPDDPDIEDAVELIELDAAAHADDPPEMYEVEVGNREQRRMREIELASGSGDQETPGRWVAGRFVSWWHDKGDDVPEDYSAWDAADTSHLDGEVWPEETPQ